MPTNNHHIILDRLGKDLLVILRDHLSKSKFRLDRLTLHILLTLSKKVYVDQLLFRDFDATSDDLWRTYESIDKNGKRFLESIHVQAFVYAEELMARRLTLAQHLYDKPTNMHVLLAELCQYGPDDRWQHTMIERDPQQVPNGDSLDFFRSVALELSDKLAKLGDHITDIAKNRRSDYGSLWLKTGPCVAEVPEELSLTDVLEILPKPLVAAFVEDLGLRTKFVRVLDSLNERYMLLRSVGLNPLQWLARSKPSINNLKELKLLRKQARTQLQDGETQDLYHAYQRAFDTLSQGKKWASYENFAEFALSEVGRVLLRQGNLSLDDSRDPIDEEQDEHLPRSETLPDETADTETIVNFERKLQILLQEQPHMFGDTVTQYCFWQLLGQGRSLRGENGILQDPDLQRLLQANPNYVGFSEDALADRLWQALNNLVKRAKTRIQKALTNDEDRTSPLS